MKTIVLKIGAAIMLVLMISISYVPEASANFKQYCGNQEFLDINGGNNPKVKPHIHCGKDYLSYKKTSNNHINVCENNNCYAQRADRSCQEANAVKPNNPISPAISSLCTDERLQCPYCNK